MLLWGTFVESLTLLHILSLMWNSFSTVIFVSQINISLYETISEGEKELKSKPFSHPIF
jgi:hypothetical protein